MSASLADFLKLPRRTSVADIGANPIDGVPPYRKMHELGLCTLVGFEPQAEALAVLQRSKRPDDTYLPYAIGDGGEHSLHICHGTGMSSLLEPDPEMLRLFNQFPELGIVVKKEKVQTRRLDDLKLPEIDLLKIDVQGSELVVLQHARETLRTTVFVHIEVSFLPLYKNQPVFWQIDKELREQGFVPHRIAETKEWTLAPLVVNQNPQFHLNQILEADMVYCRNFVRPEMMSVAQWKQLAVIAFYCYESPDLALRAVNALVHLGALPNTAPQQFVKALQGMPSNVTFALGPQTPDPR